MVHTKAQLTTSIEVIKRSSRSWDDLWSISFYTRQGGNDRCIIWDVGIVARTCVLIRKEAKGFIINLLLGLQLSYSIFRFIRIESGHEYIFPRRSKVCANLNHKYQPKIILAINGTASCFLRRELKRFKGMLSVSSTPLWSNHTQNRVAL